MVLIELPGGNDGLNTIIPINHYGQYYNSRANIAIPQAGLRSYITLDSTLPDNQQIGLHPDMVAEMFGFKSGDELVLALLAAKPVKEEVDSRLDARMLAEYGDMNTPAEMEVQVL